VFLSISTQIHISASKVMTQTCDLVLSHEHTVAHPYQIHWDTGKETTLEAPLGHSLEDHQKAKRPLGLAAQDHNSVRSSTPFPSSWNRCHMMPPKKKWWISRPEWTRMIPEGPGGATPGLPQRISAGDWWPRWRFTSHGPWAHDWYQSLVILEYLPSIRLPGSGSL